MSDALKVLLVEDNPDDRVLIAALLGQHLPGCMVVEAPDAVSFAQCFAEADFSVAIAALDLGWGAGREVLASIKRRHPGCIAIALADDGASAHGAPYPFPAGGAASAVDATVPKSRSGLARLPGLIAALLDPATDPAVARPDPAVEELLWERLPIGAFSLSADGEILKANTAFGERLGFRHPNELLGHQLPDLVVDREARVRLRSQLQAGSAAEPGTIELRGDTGNIIRGRLSLWPTAGEPRRFHGLLADPAGAVPAGPPGAGEELESLTATVFHELRDPMQLMAQYAELLVAPDAAERHRDLAERLRELVHRVQSTLRGMAEYTDQRDKEIGSLERVDLARALEELRAELRDEIEACGASVSVTTLPTVTGERRALKQLFRQLLSNALKFRGQAPPQIWIAAEERNNDWLISVRDNGVGIAPEASERIFDIFEQLHDPGEYEGAGVGLAIARRVAQRHGGDIWARASEDGGTVFLVTLSKRGARRRGAPGPGGGPAHPGPGPGREDGGASRDGEPEARLGAIA